MIRQPGHTPLGAIISIKIECEAPWEAKMTYITQLTLKWNNAKAFSGRMARVGVISKR